MKAKIAEISNRIRTSPVEAFGAASALEIASKAFGRGWGSNREDKAMVLSTFGLIVHMLGDPEEVNAEDILTVCKNIQIIQDTFGKYSRQIAFFRGVGDLPPGKELGGVAEKELQQALKMTHEYALFMVEKFKEWIDLFWSDEVMEICNKIASTGQEHVLDRIPQIENPEPALPSGYGDW